MGSTFENMKQQLNEFYQSLNKKQRILIGVSGLLIISSLALLIYFTARPEYEILYRDLSLKDSGEMTKKLDEMGIPWKNGDRETTILVPKEHVNKAKMNLAVEGFPKEGFSYEDMLNNSSLTMTNDERNRRYLVALMNTLSRTIEEIDGVNKAIVNLTVADNSNFLINQQKSKASVLVDLDPSKTLQEDQVNGIVMIVSNAVKELEPENISVVDNKGRILNKKTEDNVFSASTQMNLQQGVQNDLKNSIEQFLSTVYGQGNVAVLVNVKLDFDSEILDSKEFAPPIPEETEGLIRSMNELKEQVINSPQGGIPGTDSNVDDITQYVENNGDSSTYDKANKTINYELNEIRKQIVKAQGQVKDITVAVVINKKTLVDQEMTDEHRQEIVNLVSASAGLDTRVVEVMARDFDTSLADQLANAAGQGGNGIFDTIPIWAVALMLAMLLGTGGYAVYRTRQRKKEMESLLAEAPIMPVDEDVEEIELDINEKSNYKKQINNFVDRKPDAVAQLLKTWLNED